MKQMTLQLDSRQQRPVVRLKKGLRALLDTGAYIPVWTDDEDILVENLGASLITKDVFFPDLAEKQEVTCIKYPLMWENCIIPI